MKTNNITLNDILSDPAISVSDERANPGVVIIDTSIIYPQDLEEIMKFGVQVDTHPGQVIEQAERCSQFRNYFFHYKVFTTLGVARESIRMKRTVSKRIKDFKNFRDRCNNRKWSGSELVNALNHFEHGIKGMVKAVAGAVYVPKHPGSYDALVNFVYHVADQKGLSLGRIAPEEVGKKLRTDEGIVALALYLSIFEGRPSNIVTGDIKDIPPLFYESEACLTAINPDFFPQLQNYRPKIFVPDFRKGHILGQYRIFNEAIIKDPIRISGGKAVKISDELTEKVQEHYKNSEFAIIS